MKFKPTWSRAVMRTNLFSLKEGDKVLITPFPFKHKTQIGPVWFIFNGLHAYQVAESFGGRNLCKLITTAGGLYSDQAAANAKFKPFFLNWSKNRIKTPK